MELSVRRLKLMLRVLDMVSAGESRQVELRMQDTAEWTSGDWYELGRLRADLRTRLSMMREVSTIEDDYH